MAATWNRQYFVLLPKDHRLSYLIALHEHSFTGHLGVESTIAKIRSKFWIIGIHKTVKSIISRCVKCKLKFKRFTEQKMSPLPIETIKHHQYFTMLASTILDHSLPKERSKNELEARVMVLS